jgi:hypothetical protein
MEKPGALGEKTEGTSRTKDIFVTNGDLQNARG